MSYSVIADILVTSTSYADETEPGWNWYPAPSVSDNYMTEGRCDPGEIDLLCPTTVMPYSTGNFDPFATTTLPLGMDMLARVDEREREARNQFSISVWNDWTFCPLLPGPNIVLNPGVNDFPQMDAPVVTTPTPAPHPVLVELVGTTPPDAPRMGPIDLPDITEELQYLPFSSRDFQLVDILHLHLPATELATNNDTYNELNPEFFLQFR